MVMKSFNLDSKVSNEIHSDKKHNFNSGTKIQLIKDTNKSELNSASLGKEKKFGKALENLHCQILSLRL